MTAPGIIHHPSSYRDPSGFLFYQNGTLYRQVNRSYAASYDLLMGSGLYDSLVKKQLLVPHVEIDQNISGNGDWYRTLQPEAIPFISYPYEWCFDMLKDAALLTLEVAREAMQHGMMLKDASAYNVQWHRGKMVFIDSLSFEKLDVRQPWIAYRQFCEHFAVPLALMHYLQEPLQPMMAAYPDGIPVTLAGKMLPWRSRFQVHVYLHILLHGKMAARAHMQPGRTQTFSRAKWENLLRSLEVMIRSFSFGRQTGVWSDYYHEAGTRDGYLERKKEIVAGWIGRHAFRTAIDVGANEGVFTTMLAEKNVFTISSDLDHYSVNRLYASLKEQHTQNVVPLVMDLSHPSPAIGVNNEERSSFLSRAHADVALSLALIHHLCIGRNIPFAGVAAMFRQMAPHLIIEFVPKQDEKVVQMLQQKPDVYEWYTDENFLAAFEQHFTVQEQQPVAGSGRTLYLMQAR